MCDEHPVMPAPPLRVVNYQLLAAYYRIDPTAEEGSETSPPERFALAMIESREPTSNNYLTTARTFEDACQLAGEEVLDSGRLPDAVYDLHTGARIELHTTTPIVTRGEDQGIMVNPLERDAGAQGGEKP